MTVIFLAVPLIIYDQFRAADEAQNAVLLRSVHEHGHVIAQALAPMLAANLKPPLPQVGQDLARFADDFTNVKLLFAPGGTPGFFYVASWPPVPAPQLDAERETLKQQGILSKLSTTCNGEFPMAVRYRTPNGGDEVVTSVTPLKTMAGCWVVVTSSSAMSPPGSTLGRRVLLPRAERRARARRRRRGVRPYGRGARRLGARHPPRRRGQRACLQDADRRHPPVARAGEARHRRRESARPARHRPHRELARQARRPRRLGAPPRRGDGRSDGIAAHRHRSLARARPL